jgi:hypothetical protein
MRRPLAIAAALLLAVPPAASGGTGAARLLVSATVVRTLRVSVTEGASGTAALRVRTVGGGAWSVPALSLSNGPALRLSASGGAAVPAGVGVAPYAADSSYVVVTILADAPSLAGADAAAACDVR